MLKEPQVGQTYLTHGGTQVRILAKVSNETHPFIATLSLWTAGGNPHEVARQYTAEGKLNPASDHYDDINLEEPSDA